MDIKKMATAVALTMFVATVPAAMAKDHGRGRGHAKGAAASRGGAWSDTQRAQFDQQFARFDRNGDGVVTRAEFPADAATFDRLDRNGDGVLSDADRAFGQGRNGNDRQMRFRGMDRNGDGLITRDEWRGNEQSFRNHDRNGDGVLTGDELRGNGQGRGDERGRGHGRGHDDDRDDD